MFTGHASCVTGRAASPGCLAHWPRPSGFQALRSHFRRPKVAPECLKSRRSPGDVSDLAGAMTPLGLI
ncbi:hypothetical protein ACFOLD_09275 [Kocuria carniphila]|uniref:hypothetical protein n=1 Tax=Kocuria carniphila TaxID=262208 RepID=UPI0036156A9F